MKLEIGGGTFARGDGWVNLDRIESADIIHDLERMPWPLGTGTVDAIYSSHCIEHVTMPVEFLKECVRIGKVGCEIEIRCPAPFSELMFVSDHKHCFSPQAARNMEHHFPQNFWTEPKRARLVGYIFQCSEKLQRAKDSLPFLAGLDDQTIMEFIPGTAHETVFNYIVQENEHVG